MTYVDHGSRHIPGGTDPIPGLGSGGDYVFLEEIQLSSPARYLEENDLDQSYRHLVVELSLGAIYGSSVGDWPEAGTLMFEGKSAPSYEYDSVYGYSPQIRGTDEGSPAVPLGEEPTGGDSRTILPGILAWDDLNYSAGFSFPFTAVTMKFLNYSSTDFWRPRSCLWQAVTWASFAPSGEVARYSSGGLIFEDHGQPLTDFRFSSTPLTYLADQGSWSSVTAYVVGDRVLQGGVRYICVANNTNQVPPNSSYWVLYQPLLDEDSMMSIYGIR